MILSTSPYFADGTPHNLVDAYNQIVGRGGRPVPLRVDRRPLHGARPRRDLRLGGGRHRGPGPGRRAHHRRPRWTTSSSRRSTRSSPTWRGRSTPATRKRPPAACVVVAIAHRGEPVGHRENTLPAFAAAVALGADMVELDLRRTRDGAIVVLHDQTLAAPLGRRRVGGRPGPGRGGGPRRGRRAHPDPARRARRGAVPLMVDFTRREVVAGALAGGARRAGARPLPVRDGQRRGPAHAAGPLGRGPHRADLAGRPGAAAGAARRAGGGVLEPDVRAGDARGRGGGARGGPAGVDLDGGHRRGHGRAWWRPASTPS